MSEHDGSLFQVDPESLEGRIVELVRRKRSQILEVDPETREGMLVLAFRAYNRNLCKSIIAELFHEKDEIEGEKQQNIMVGNKVEYLVKMGMFSTAIQAIRAHEAWLEGQADVPEGIRYAGLDSTPLEVLKLDVRTKNMLEKENIMTVQALLLVDEKDLLDIENLGETTLGRIKAACKAYLDYLKQQADEARKAQEKLDRMEK